MIPVRDIFAGLAMLGLLVNQQDDESSIGAHEDWAEAYAEAAYTTADAMLNVSINKENPRG